MDGTERARPWLALEPSTTSLSSRWLIPKASVGLLSSLSPFSLLPLALHSHFCPGSSPFPSAAHVQASDLRARQTAGGQGGGKGGGSIVSPPPSSASTRSSRCASLSLYFFLTNHLSTPMDPPVPYCQVGKPVRRKSTTRVVASGVQETRDPDPDLALRQEPRFSFCNHQLRFPLLSNYGDYGGVEMGEAHQRWKPE
jgi:hypothetical protein